MRTLLMLSLLMLTAAPLASTPGSAEASPGPNVSININGYLPAPPGVVVRVDAGRPYYIQNERRVYMEKEHPRHAKNRHYKGGQRHHDKYARYLNHDNSGHDKHKGR
jgi:hypothetical protein